MLSMIPALRRQAQPTIALTVQKKEKPPAARVAFSLMLDD
jgi:hypothetical protein